jgi:hypothetical protein
MSNVSEIREFLDYPIKAFKTSCPSPASQDQPKPFSDFFKREVAAELSPAKNNLCRPEIYYPAFKRSASKMSGTSDKARFYLEQAVPQLQEFKEKEIFTTV